MFIIKCQVASWVKKNCPVLGFPSSTPSKVCKGSLSWSGGGSWIRSPWACFCAWSICLSHQAVGLFHHTRTFRLPSVAPGISPCQVHCTVHTVSKRPGQALFDMQQHCSVLTGNIYPVATRKPHAGRSKRALSHRALLSLQNIMLCLLRRPLWCTT